MVGKWQAEAAKRQEENLKHKQQAGTQKHCLEDELVWAKVPPMHLDLHTQKYPSQARDDNIALQLGGNDTAIWGEDCSPVVSSVALSHSMAPV